MEADDVACHAPADEGEQGDDQHSGDEDAGDRIGEALDRRLGALSLLYEPDDAGEHRVTADLGCLHAQHAGLVERGADDRVARALLDRQALAGQHCFIHS